MVPFLCFSTMFKIAQRILKKILLVPVEILSLDAHVLLLEEQEILLENTRGKLFLKSSFDSNLVLFLLYTSV